MRLSEQPFLSHLLVLTWQRRISALSSVGRRNHIECGSAAFWYRSAARPGNGHQYHALHCFGRKELAVVEEQLQRFRTGIHFSFRYLGRSPYWEPQNVRDTCYPGQNLVPLGPLILLQVHASSRYPLGRSIAWLCPPFSGSKEVSFWPHHHNTSTLSIPR